jgi:lactoylglutathione lyase
MSSDATSAATVPFDTSEYETTPVEAATFAKDFVMQQTMMRIKEPKRSLDFYIRGLGMQLVLCKHFPQWKFSLFFCGYLPKGATLPSDPQEREMFARMIPGLVELTWNHGSESKDSEVYNTGNSSAVGTQDGKPVKGGFGHIGITVPDVYATCQRLHDMGYKFQKSPNSGGMKGLAFVVDPDGYWVEILRQKGRETQPVDCCGVALEGGTYKSAV